MLDELGTRELRLSSFQGIDGYLGKRYFSRALQQPSESGAICLSPPTENSVVMFVCIFSFLAIQVMDQ